MNNTIWFIIAASLIQFIIGALWYGGLFQKNWSYIMEFDKKTVEEQKALEASMTPYYGVQLLVVILTTSAFAYLYPLIKDRIELMPLCLLLLIGFQIQPIIEGVIWGNTRQKVWPQQALIQIGNHVVNFLVIYLCAMFLLK
jgi:Protein of unknown function (DUF1761)